MKKFMLRRAGVTNESGSLKPSLHECLETVLGQSDILLGEVLSGLQVSLSPVKSQNQRLQPGASGKAAIERLCANSGAVKKTFAESLRAAVYGGDVLSKREQPLVRFEDFQFLEEDQIDANIELALTQQEVMLAVDDVLTTFNGFVSSLMGWSTVQAHSNPLKPDSFVYALRECFVAHIASEEVRTSLMTPAAGMLGVGLRQLYKETIDWLRALGIEPVRVASAGAGGLGASKKPEENSVTRTMLTLDKLRRLLSGELNPAGVGGSGSLDFSHTVPASFVALEDMQLMEPMMKRLSKRAAEAATEPVSARAALADKGVASEQTKSKKLGRELGEEVVRLMLDNLMQDHRLLSGVRKNLKTMEPTLLALSEADPRFFSERKHPARQFLDKITSRSLAFSSEDEPGYTRFQKTIDNAVSVLVGAEGDAAAFARILRKLEEGWAQEEHEQRQRAEEAARGLMHAEQRNLLAERLAQDFSERLHDKQVPDIVANFLRGPWAQVVAESQLTCTDGTVDANGYLALVDDLIWSVQSRLARRNRARLVEIVPGMLVTLRQGLNLIAYPPERIPAFFDALITFHEKAFEGMRPAPAGEVGGADNANAGAEVPALGATGAEVPPSSEAEGYWMGESEDFDSGYLARTQVPPDVHEQEESPDRVEQQDWTAESLNTGSWVDLALGGVWVRAQLTWASPHRTLFMFISGTGLAHSMSKRTMDRLRGMGLIRLVSDGRVLDNALDAVAQAALRNDVANASGGS